MEFDKYVELTKLTAIYPEDKKFEYLYLGLLSEVGEVAGVYKKYIRDGFSTDELQEKMKKEIGDCFWYLARMLDELYEKEQIKLIYKLSCLSCGYNEQIIKDSKGKELDFLSLIIGLIKDVVWLVPDNSSYHTIQDSVDVFDSLLGLCFKFDLPPALVMKKNIEKLLDRKQRNVLRGDGDER